MRQLPEAVVGDAATSNRHWNLLADLVDLDARMAGWDGEERAAERVASAFEEVGLRNVAVEEFGIDGWWRGSSSLATAGVHEEVYVKDYQVIGLPGTPSGAVEGRLVDVGYGRPEEFEERDVEGAVAMASSATPEDADRWLHRMEKYATAVDAGAAGFVFANHVPGALPPTGEVGYDVRPGPVPAVGVSKEVGERLARHAGAGDLRARLDVEARSGPATSRNVVGDLGPDTDAVVLLTSHVDAHDVAEGASDNGAGTALVAEVARLLTRVESDLDTRVRVEAFGAEEIGLKGASHAADRLDLDDVECVINVDGAGGSRTLAVRHNEFEELERLFADVADLFDVPLESSAAVSPHGDQWAFVQEGVPGAMAASASEGSGRGWGHTHADTLDKLDRRDLRDLSVLLATATLNAASDEYEFDRRTPAATRELLDEGYERELKVGGRWPYGEES